MNKFVILTCVGVIAGACGEKKKQGSSANIKMSLSNVSAGSSLNLDNGYVTPTYFGMKLSYGGLRENQDASMSPVGIEALTYADPGCSTYEAKEEIGDKEYSVITPTSRNCATKYVNLARDSASVNAELNAQQFPVPPGTYRYVYLCYASAYEVQVADYMANKTEFVKQGSDEGTGCVSTALSELTVAEGETITLEVAYDLSKDSVAVLPKEAQSGAICKDSDNANYQVCVNGGAHYTVTASR